MILEIIIAMCGTLFFVILFPCFTSLKPGDRQGKHFQIVTEKHELKTWIYKISYYFCYICLRCDSISQFGRRDG